jgi:hypothetical protein
LTIDAPEGVLDPDLIARLRAHKAELVVVLRSDFRKSEPTVQADRDPERDAIQWAEAAPAEESDAALLQARRDWADIVGRPRDDIVIAAGSDDQSVEEVFFEERHPPESGIWTPGGCVFLGDRPRLTDDEIEANWAEMSAEDYRYATALRKPLVPPKEPVCEECGSRAMVEVKIHQGQSTRVDCRKCGRFVYFKVWQSEELSYAPKSRFDGCPWCGLRLGHTDLCLEFNNWEPIVPWGRFKGRPLCDVPLDYLRWLVTRTSLGAEFLDAAKKRLEAEISHSPQHSEHHLG